jgi:hypothetical protein
MVCGFAAFFIGAHSLFVLWKVKRLPVFSFRWWFLSRGVGTKQQSTMHTATANDEEEETASDLEMKETNENSIEDATTGGGGTTSLSNEVV